MQLPTGVSKRLGKNILMYKLLIQTNKNLSFYRKEETTNEYKGTSKTIYCKINYDVYNVVIDGCKREKKKC